MKTIALHRVPGNFITTDYKVTRCWTIHDGGTYENVIRPRICAGATSRMFRLGRGAKKVNAIFTKAKPAGKSYRIRAFGTYGGTQCGTLVGFTGSFLEGVTQALGDLHAEGNRYVRIERVL